MVRKIAKEGQTNEINRITKKRFDLCQIFFMRCPADSNCCGRFCRPLPSLSVRAPFLFCVAKVQLFFYTANISDKKSFFYFFFHQNAKLQHKSIQIKRAIKERNYIKIK